MRHEFGIILAATLTLLGLLIGFSFSMAGNRYDLPAKMPVPKNFSYGALAPYLPPLPTEIGSKPKPKPARGD